MSGVADDPTLTAAHAPPIARHVTSTSPSVAEPSKSFLPSMDVEAGIESAGNGPVGFHANAAKATESRLDAPRVCPKWASGVASGTVLLTLARSAANSNSSL